MISVALASSQEAAEPDQELLVIAIAAAILRTRLDQPMCAEDRSRLTAELEHIEQVRHRLEQHVAALARSRRPWWRHLLRV